MIYERSQLLDLLSCQHCLQPYAENHSPRILACCGKTICNQCIDLATKNTQCVVCGNKCLASAETFLLNRPIAKLLSQKPKQLYKTDNECCLFYETSFINGLLKCEACEKSLNAQYLVPRILPCCGKTICHVCVQITEDQLNNNNNNKCMAACGIILLRNTDGFPINYALVELIAKQPKEISRGPEADRLLLSLDDLENLINKLIFESENGDFLIMEDCKELRRQVQLTKEEKMQEIDEHCDALFKKIATYEEMCIREYKQINESKQRVNEFIKSIQHAIQIQYEYLMQLRIDDKETIICNQKMQELKTQIESERKIIRKSIFHNKMMNFDVNKSLIDEKLLGTLIQGAFEFFDLKILISAHRAIKLLDLKTNECLKTFEGHSRTVNCVKYLNENQIVSCSYDRSIKIWDKTTGDCIRTLSGHLNTVWCIAVLSNERIASCSSDRTIRVWEVESGRVIQILNGHTDVVNRIAKLSDVRLLSCSEDSTIKLWNVDSAECLRTLSGHLKGVLFVDIFGKTKDLHFLVMSGSKDTKIKIWNINTGLCLQTLEGHTNAVECIQILSGNKIISGSWDLTIRIWCLNTNSCIQTINAHLDAVYEIKLLADNKLASSSQDGTIKIWDLDSAECIKTFNMKSVSLSIDAF